MDFVKTPSLQKLPVLDAVSLSLQPKIVIQGSLGKFHHDLAQVCLLKVSSIMDRLT